MVVISLELVLQAAAAAGQLLQLVAAANAAAAAAAAADARPASHALARPGQWRGLAKALVRWALRCLSQALPCLARLGPAHAGPC